MSRKTQFFVPRNWQKFQHYKDRKPAWIKLHIELLDDYEFNQLTDMQQFILMKIWMLFAKTGKPIPTDTRWIGKQLNIDTRAIGKAIPTLLSNEFIVLEGKDASSPLAVRYGTATLEKEVDTDIEERVPPLSPPQGGDPPGGPPFDLSNPPTEEPDHDKQPAAKPKRNRGTRIADDWEPGDSDRDFARQLGFLDSEIDWLGASMRDYFAAKSGQQACKTNWSATFRNWCRKDIDMHGPPANRRNRTHDKPSRQTGYNQQTESKHALLAGITGHAVAKPPGHREGIDLEARLGTARIIEH